MTLPMRALSFFAVVLSLAVGCGKCGKRPDPTQAEPPPGPATPTPSTRTKVTLGSLSYQLQVPAPARPFAGKRFEDPKVAIVPSAVDAGASSAPGWKYVPQLMVAPGTFALLEKEGIAVDGNRAYDEFFQIYEQNRYRPLEISREEVNDDDGFLIKRRFLTSFPSVVTTDVVLHHLHLFFDYALAQAEVQRFLPELEAIVVELLDATLEQRTALAGTKWEAAIDDNLVFLSVAHVFLASADLDERELASKEDDGSTVGVDTAEQAHDFAEATRSAVARLLPKTLPAGLGARVTAEVNRILDAKETAKPDVYDYPGDFKEDYSQYTVRGHYLKLTKLQAYFRAMMWLSRVLFSFDSDRGVRGAVLLSLSLSKGDTLARWRALDEAIGFLVGPSDDASVLEVSSLVAVQSSLDDVGLEALRAKFAKLPKPQVQSILTKTEAGPSLETQGAFHFFSQRAVIDAVIFQSLVEPKAKQKSFVRALEVPDVLGSALAAKLLEPENLAQFAGYAEQRAALKSTMPKLLASRASSEAVAGWLFSTQPMLEPAAPGLPPFMAGNAYATLRLSTYLANYAELKHDTVLYAKQGLAEMGGPGFEDTEEQIDDRGYVVPELAIYSRAGVVLSNLRTGLTERKLFPDSLGAPFGKFEKLVGALEAISRKELTGQALSADEYQLIKFIGGDLEHFWEQTLITGKNRDRWMLLDENNSRLIADVFTGPGGVQHVASGWVHPVYVVFPRDGKPAVGRGGVLSFYEVTDKERLTDSVWRTRLGAEPRPALPAWTKPVFASEPKGPFRRYDEMAEE